MKKNIIINGISLSYFEVNNECEDTLVFIHGNSSSHNIFINQQNEFKNYRLIFIDLPGHGESQFLSDYSLPIYSDVLSSLVNYFNLDKYILIGHSLGGHIALHSLRKLNPDGIFIFGTSPIGESFDPASFLENQKSYVLFSESADRETVSSFMQDLGNDVAGVFDYYRTDGKARTDLLSNIAMKNYFNELDLIKDFKGNLGILFLNNDAIINNDYLNKLILKNNIYCESSELSSGHYPQIEKPTEFNFIIERFCKHTFKNIKTVERIEHNY